MAVTLLDERSAPVVIDAALPIVAVIGADAPLFPHRRDGLDHRRARAAGHPRTPR